MNVIFGILPHLKGQKLQVRDCKGCVSLPCRPSELLNPKQAGLFEDWYGGGGGADSAPL